MLLEYSGNFAAEVYFRFFTIFVFCLNLTASTRQRIRTAINFSVRKCHAIRKNAGLKFGLQT